MPGIMSVIISVALVTISIYLGSNFLTEPDTSTIKEATLTFYKSVYESAQSKDKGGVIGFGYTGCKDISVDTFDFLDELKVPFVPQEKTRVVTIQDFVETFASFFSVGASTEIFMENKENFEELMSKMENLDSRATFGGNAPHMALRAAKENYSAVLVADIGQDEVNTIEKLDVDSKIHIVPINETRNTSDIHLIFEYPMTKYKGIKSPKGNKFYLNHDTISPKLLALDKYLEVANEFNVTKHALSGFHLIQKLPVEEALGLIVKIQSQWDSLRLRGPQTIHVEMGAFQESKLYQSVIENLLTRADSLGINEQEILILHAFLKDKAFKTLTIPYSDSSILLQKLFDIIEMLEQKKSTLSRLHVHAKSMHHLCYREDLWESGLEGLVSGILVGYKMCCNTTGLNPRSLTMNYNVLDEVSKSFKFPDATLSLKSSPILSIRKGKWVCLSGMALICQTVKKMAGLGDNISSAGFVHHSMIHNNK